MDKYGRWTVLFEYINTDGYRYCHCVCDCGTVRDIYKRNLVTGKTKSCGCYKKELLRQSLCKTNDYIFDKEKGIAIGRATNTGKEFLVDLEDYDLIKDLSWYEANTGYMHHKDKGEHIIQMHRLLANAPDDKVVDHINHNKADNRKSNLRVCTQKENSRNRLTAPKGVWEVKRGTNTYWVVQLYGKYHGCFKTYEDAKALRDQIVARRSYL